MIQIFFSDSDKVLSKAIRAVTWSEYSHVGIIDHHRGTVIDSRLTHHGVSEYPAAKLYSEYPRISIRTFHGVPDSAIDLARSQVGKGYDWTALLGGLIHRDWQEEDKWFCSELVAWACLKAGAALINKEASRVTPQDLWEAVDR